MPTLLHTLALTWSLADPVAGACTTESASASTASPPAKGRRNKRVGSPAPTTTPAVGIPGQPGECVDATLQEQLTRDRLFVKALRHELTLAGGYYVSDLFDGTFTLGGQYTFFMSENFGAELSVGWSRLRSSVLDTIESANNFSLAVGGQDIIRVFGSLAWSPLYGKLRLVAAKILRYDLYLLAGPGVVVDPVSFGAAGNFGLGVRIFLHPAVALRFEARDYLYRQSLLSESYYVNDFAFTTGLSVLVPLRN
jgi:outer membrane beta-barrel protein